MYRVSLLVDGRKVLTDKHGYLVHSSDWHESVAEAIAQREALTLLKDHWHVIYLMRSLYQQYHKTPSIRSLVNQLSVQIGVAKASSLYLSNLFPKGVLKQASKLAGLPPPSHCM